MQGAVSINSTYPGHVRALTRTICPTCQLGAAAASCAGGGCEALALIIASESSANPVAAAIIVTTPPPSLEAAHCPVAKTLDSVLGMINLNKVLFHKDNATLLYDEDYSSSSKQNRLMVMKVETSTTTTTKQRQNTTPSCFHVRPSCSVLVVGWRTPDVPKHGRICTATCTSK